MSEVAVNSNEELDGDDQLLALIQNYEVSSRLQAQVLQDIRQMADQALPKAAEPSDMTPGESLIFWALSQQLDVIHAQMTQLEQLNLAILKQVLQNKSQA